jgi:hypothetical protein
VRSDGRAGWAPGALQELLDEPDREYGPATEEEKVWAESVAFGT